MPEKEDEDEEKRRGNLVFMWGFLPGASTEGSPLLSPTVVPSPEAGDAIKDVCGGGCGFALAISERGSLFTWGSTDELCQSYIASGGHGEVPEPFVLPTKVSIVNAAAGWAHCASVTEKGEVYTWGWKECIPAGDSVKSPDVERPKLKDTDGCSHLSDNDELLQSLNLPSDISQDTIGVPGRSSISGGFLHNEVAEVKSYIKGSKRRRLWHSRQSHEGTDIVDEDISTPVFIVTMLPGTKISIVATGGRHTLALSDSGQLWGWGYGGEGQLGLGNHIRVVSSPHLITCFEVTPCQKQRLQACPIETSQMDEARPHGSYIKTIACGGRHSAVITDAGELLTFGWGLYGQCGHGSTDDKLSPSYVTSLGGVQLEGVGAGLWHTLCISKDGDVYAFGGNQFGQLGTGDDQSVTLPTLLEDSTLENKHATIVSCGARHSAVVTEDGGAFSWGWNKYGQLGIGDAVDRNLPCEVLCKGCSIMNISCGWWHTLALAKVQ